MPPQRMSRHSFCAGLTDAAGAFFLEDAEPFGFQDFPDTVPHIVGSQDTLFTLAGIAYAVFERPAGLWWVIADFQPDPILDPFVKLVEGSTIYVPSVRVVQEFIFDDRRRTEVIG